MHNGIQKMNTKKNVTFTELQEILFWQSLNKQLIALSEKGHRIKKSDHKYLQGFCFQNRIFSKITTASIIDETPLALISDFKTLSFLTINIPQWKKVLSRIMPKAYILDCNKALADSFDVLSKYDKKYNLTGEAGVCESDDEELYDFINQYMDLRDEKHIKEFSDIVKETHRFRSIALNKIITEFKYKPPVMNIDKDIIIDLGVLNNASQLQGIREIYIEDYCRKAETILRTGFGNYLDRKMKYSNVLTWLEKKYDQKNVKPSIKDFIAYELPIFMSETNLEDKYLQKIQRITSGNFTKIGICNIYPFFFLKNPLPLV